MNYVALEPVVTGVQFLTAPSFSSEPSFLFSAQFIYTILFVLIIFTTMIKLSGVGVKRYVLQVYGQYNGQKVSTQDEWDNAQKEIFRDFMKIVLGLAMLFFLSLALFILNHNLLN